MVVNGRFSFTRSLPSLTMLCNSGNDQRRPSLLQILQTGTTRVYGSGRDFQFNSIQFNSIYFPVTDNIFNNYGSVHLMKDTFKCIFHVCVV